MATHIHLSLREGLLDTATDVALRFRVFEEYGSDTRAAHALRRRKPGFDPSDYTDAFFSALALFDAACARVEADAADIRHRGWLTEEKAEQYARALADEHPGFAASTLRW